MTRGFAFLLFALSANGELPISSDSQARGQDLEQWATKVGVVHEMIELRGRPRDGYYRAYLCPAYSNVLAIAEDFTDQEATQHDLSAQKRALQAKLKFHGCIPARGRFWVAAVGPEFKMNLGVEASENWTALDVDDERHNRRGLLIDSSLYAIKD